MLICSPLPSWRALVSAISSAFRAEVVAPWSGPDSITSVKLTIAYPKTFRPSQMKLLLSVNRSASGLGKGVSCRSGLAL